MPNLLTEVADVLKGNDSEVKINEKMFSMYLFGFWFFKKGAREAQAI